MSMPPKICDQAFDDFRMVARKVGAERVTSAISSLASAVLERIRGSADVLLRRSCKCSRCPGHASINALVREQAAAASNAVAVYFTLTSLGFIPAERRGKSGSTRCGEF